MNIAVHIPFHRWEVTRGGKWAARMMDSPQWWSDRAAIFRDWTLRSLLAQTDQDFKIVVSFRLQDYRPGNAAVLACVNYTGASIDHPRPRLISFARRYQDWQYHIAPNQADFFCKAFGGTGEWLAILTVDSDDCYERTVVEQIRQVQPREGLCCWFAYGYLYGIDDGRLARFGSVKGPPPFFCKFYPPMALTTPEAFNAYRQKWGLNCYHHETSRLKVNERMPDRLFMQTIHAANATTNWTHRHTTSHVGGDVTLIAEKAKTLESFGVADNG